MNVRKGFRRLWIALAGLWLASGLLIFVGSGDKFDEEYFLGIVGVPIAIAALGLVAEWVIRGFQDP